MINSKEPQQKYCLRTVSIKILGGLIIVFICDLFVSRDDPLMS